MKPNKHLESLLEKLNGKPQSMVEHLIMEQGMNFIKSLPPLPPGWVYDFIPSEPHYNPETKCWEGTMEAVPRQKYIIKED